MSNRELLDEIADTQYQLSGVERRLRIVENPTGSKLYIEHLRRKAEEFLREADQKEHRLRNDASKYAELLSRKEELSGWLKVLRSAIHRTQKNSVRELRSAFRVYWSQRK